MKKLLCSLMIAAMLLCGCNTRVRPQIDISGKYYYLTSHVAYGSGSTATLLHRFNVENGSMTPLCPDPLCEHSEEAGCPFAGALNYTVEGDTIWFNRKLHNRDEETVTVICRYDIAAGKLRVLHEYRDDGYTYMFKFGYLWKYFTHANPTEKDISIRVSLAEENFNTPEEIDPNKIPFAQVGDIYYYSAYGTNHSPATEVYAMYTDLSDEWLVADGVFSMNFTYYDGFLYYIQAGTLMRVSVDEELTGLAVNTKESVMHAVAAYFFHNGYLYYLQSEGDDAEVIGWDEFLEEEVKNTYGGKIWRAKPDGTMAKVFVEMDGYVISKSMLSDAQVGSRLVVRYGCWTEKQRDGAACKAWRAAEGGLLVVDLNDRTYEAYPVFDE